MGHVNDVEVRLDVSLEGAMAIAKERLRQQVNEGFSAYHDEQHMVEELTDAAIAYALLSQGNTKEAREVWPWRDHLRTSDTTRRALAKAGALIAAALDRLGEEPGSSRDVSIPTEHGFDYGERGSDGQHERHPTVDTNDVEFERPIRHSYKHLNCGCVTRMGDAIARTYAAKPNYYDTTFCMKCRDYFPVGADGEFVWIEPDGNESDAKVGT